MNFRKKEKYFVCFIDGYFPALHAFSATQNYYLYPLLLASELGYTPVAIVRGGADLMVSDPNFQSDIMIVEYRNLFQYIFLLCKYVLLRSVFYINSHTLPSYISIIFTKMFLCKNIFMGHIQPKRTSNLKQIIFNAVLVFVDRVRLNNESEKKFLVDQGISAKKLFIAPIAVNGEAFYKKNFDYSLRKDIVYYGNTTKQKGLPTIFEALAIIRNELPDVMLHIVGSRGDYNPVEDIEKYGIKNNVTMHGPFSHGEKLNNLLNTFSIFVISTKGEGQCLAVYESALTGNALCLPNIMSFKDVFKGKALFHDVNNAQVLTKNIMTYMNNPALIQEHNQACINMIQKEYSEEPVKEKLVTLLSF